MKTSSGADPADRAPLPAEIREAVQRIDLPRLYNELEREQLLSTEELATFRREFGRWLSDVWHDRNYDPNRMIPVHVEAGRRKAAWWKTEECAFSPLIAALRDGGLAGDSVLFQQGQTVLTPGRLNGHTTDRITVKSRKTTERKRLFRKPLVVQEVELDIDYPEKGRFGEYETVHLEFLTEEEERRFTEALMKARMIGNLNSFLERMRHCI